MLICICAARPSAGECAQGANAAEGWKGVNPRLERGVGPLCWGLGGELWEALGSHLPVDSHLCSTPLCRRACWGCSHCRRLERCKSVAREGCWAFPVRGFEDGFGRLLGGPWEPFASADLHLCSTPLRSRACSGRSRRKRLEMCKSAAGEGCWASLLGAWGGLWEALGGPLGAICICAV